MSHDKLLQSGCDFVQRNVEPGLLKLALRIAFQSMENAIFSVMKMMKVSPFDTAVTVINGVVFVPDDMGNPAAFDLYLESAEGMTEPA